LRYKKWRVVNKKNQREIQAGGMTL
jgi:hypothetical protein